MTTITQVPPNYFRAADRALTARARARAVMTALHVYAVVVPCGVVAGAVAFRNDVDDIDHLNRVVGAALLAAVLIGALFVVVLVLWAPWFYAVYGAVYNLGRARYQPFWGVLGWLIPYADLFVPKQLVNDLWRPERTPRVVQAWWVLWVVARVASMPLGMAVGARSGLALPLGALTAGATVATAATGARVVRVVTARVESLVAHDRGTA